MMSETKTLETMKAELVAAGYDVLVSEDNWYICVEIINPDNWKWQGIDYDGGDWQELNRHKARLEKEALEKAYAHLQKELKYQAMAAVLRQIVEWDKRFTQFPLSFMEEARRLRDE